MELPMNMICPTWSGLKPNEKPKNHAPTSTAAPAANDRVQYVALRRDATRNSLLTIGKNVML